MRNLIERWWRVSGVAIVMIGLGMVGASPVAAEEICRPNAGLGFVDGNGDGVVNQGEVQAFINAAGDAEGLDDLRAVVNNWPANLTGIRYTGCTADGGGDTGTGGGTGNNGGDTGNGGDSGNNGGDTGSGTDDGSGTGGDTGTGDGSGSGAGNEAGGTGNSTTVVMIDGTPVVVDSVTGLPATGQGDASTASLSGNAAIGLLGLAVVALVGAGALIGRTRRAI